MKPLGDVRVRDFLLTLAVPVLLLATGTLGYAWLEGWPVFDALYMAVITVTTVGFQEVHPLSNPGRAFTMLLALGGVFTLFYAATAVIRVLVNRELHGDFRRQRMERRLAALRDHTIVCGYGRMGLHICHEFDALGLPYVLVERDAALLETFHGTHGIALAGDATTDDTLRRAGVERARALVTVASSDAANLYIVMSARFLNEKLHIVARAEEDDAQKKLERAGANRVVSPYMIGGQRVAQAVLRPNVIDFLELATKRDHTQLQIEEVEVLPGSRLDGVVLKDSGVRRELGLIIVSIRPAVGEMRFNPSPETVIARGDTLIALGPRERLTQLEELAGASPA